MRGNGLLRRRWLTVVMLAVALVGGIIAVGLYVRSLDHNVNRAVVFGPSPDVSRPPRTVDGVLNVLLLGLDSADPEGTAGGVRADTIMLAHIPADRSAVQLISIPRDTWLTIPAGSYGRGEFDAKINAAYALGEAALMVQTVEAFTGVRIDHTVAIDFAGFTQIIDSLGGIDVMVDQAFTSAQEPHRRFVPGMTRMDGRTALDYARQRKPFADGDFARIRHQRAILRAVLDTASQLGIWWNPAKLDRFLGAATAALTIDETLSLMDLVLTLRHINSAELFTVTSPSAGTGMVGDQSVVFPDVAGAAALYAAVRADTVAEWISQHGTD